MNRIVCKPNNMHTMADFDIDQIFRSFCRSDFSSRPSASARADMFENENQYRIVMELAGMEKDKIKVHVQDDILTISGERVREADGDNSPVFGERYIGDFSRSFKLNDQIEVSGVSADFKNGLLEVILPRKEEKKPKEIEVKVK